MSSKKVAVVGFGFMGRMHYGCWRKTRGAKVAAVCDSNLAVLSAKIEGNVEGVDNSALPKSVAIFADFDEMLQKADIDVVDITLPTPLHADLACKAMLAGKDVLCEKPMALTVSDCDKMLECAQKTGRHLMIAQCLRFWPVYTYLKQLVESKKYGEVVAADFTRFSAAPGWNSKGPSWFLDESKSGGVALDMHIHDADVVNYLFGLPKAVTASAHYHSTGYMDHLVTQYAFDNMVVTAQASWAATQSFGFEAGFKVFFENAVVVSDAKRADGAFCIYPTNGKVIVPKLSDTTGYANEIKWFVASLSGQTENAPLTAEDARNSIALVMAERKAAKTGKRVTL